MTWIMGPISLTHAFGLAMAQSKYDIRLSNGLTPSGSTNDQVPTRTWNLIGLSPYPCRPAALPLSSRVDLPLYCCGTRLGNDKIIGTSPSCKWEGKSDWCTTFSHFLWVISIHHSPEAYKYLQHQGVAHLSFSINSILSILQYLHSRHVLT